MRKMPDSRAIADRGTFVDNCCFMRPVGQIDTLSRNG
jgi:hypothetical protein